MRNWDGEFDMSHALAAHSGEGDLDSASIAGNALMFYSFIFTASAFPVAIGAEDAFAEESPFFRFKGSVVYGFWILHLASGPGPDGFWICDGDGDVIE